MVKSWPRWMNILGVISLIIIGLLVILSLIVVVQINFFGGDAIGLILVGFSVFGLE